MRTALAEMLLPQTSPLNGEVYDKNDADRLAGVLKALADPARLRLGVRLRPDRPNRSVAADCEPPPANPHRVRLAGAGEARCVGVLPARAVGDPGDR